MNVIAPDINSGENLIKSMLCPRNAPPYIMNTAKIQIAKTTKIFLSCILFNIKKKKGKIKYICTSYGKLHKVAGIEGDCVIF